MANILILSLVFRPDNVSTAHLIADLALDLKVRGHSLTVITTTAHYNLDAQAILAQPMRRLLMGIVRSSLLEGIVVYHIWMPQKGSNKFYRMFTWVWFHVVSTIFALFVGKRFDVVFAPSPPLTIGLSAWVIAAMRRARFIYNVQEVYPDVAINLGVVRNKIIIRGLFAAEAFVYARAYAVTVISKRMCENLLRKGVPASKVRLIPNFVDIAGFAPRAKDNAFARRFKLHNAFVVGYAGNMGRPQQLEILVEAAGLLQHRGDIKIVMMGNGSECERLQQASHTLDNILFIAQQAYADMPFAYAAMDLCYVPQAPGTAADGVPSKVYRILSAGRAVLAYTEKDSDLARLIQSADAGVVVFESNARALAEAIEQIANSPKECGEMGTRGRDYVIRNYERGLVSVEYENLIKEASAASAGRI